MRASDLLRSTDHLPHGQRLRSVALEGRRLRGTAELRELLGELSRGTAFERTSAWLSPRWQARSTT